MSVPDAVIAMTVAALPGAYLWNGETVVNENDFVVFDGVVPATPPRRYVVIYIDDGTRETLAACGHSDSSTFRWQTMTVAPDRGMASWIVNRLYTLIDQRPTAVGWGCGQVNHVFSERPGRDETVADRPVVFKPDLFDLLATRA